MKLIEAEGKVLYNNFDIPTPGGVLISKLSEISSVPKTWGKYVVKAQVHTGKRGKAGGIKFTSYDNLKKTCKSLLGKKIKGEKVDQILIEQAVDVKAEYYLSLLVDRSSQDVVVVFSKKGGMDVETLSRKQPRTIQKGLYSKLSSVIKDKKVQVFCKKLYTLMTQMDCSLVEVNPLFLTKKGNLIAGDAKIVVDNNALYRHPEFLDMQSTTLNKEEQLAKKYGLHYVPLEGNIGVIGNGAGLVMATMDILYNLKMKPANFLDVGGGADTKQMQKAMQIVCSKKLKGLFINIFGGITHCDEIAQGIVNYKKRNKLRTPIAVRMIGTNEEKAKNILSKAGIQTKDSMEEGIKLLVSKVKK